MQQYMTAREIAAAAKRLMISDLPHSASGVRKYAKCWGWRNDPLKCRKRAGHLGGGFEYHISLLPMPLWAALAVDASRAEKLGGNTRIVHRFSLRDRLVFLFKGRF